MSEVVESVAAREPFDVDNDMKAEWCLNKIRKIREEQKRETDELQRQMQFYLDQIEVIKKQADSDAAFFESMLRKYFFIRVDEGFAKSTKTQTTYKLPTGKLTLKKQEPEFNRTDDVLLAWVKKNRPEYVKTAESTDWAKLKKECVFVNGKAVTKDGEIVDGVDVALREDKFIVEG